MSARLAASFRGWVRWYPASWRAANADAMLGVYLDVAEQQGRNRLTAAEKRSLAANGLAARFDRMLPAAVRDGVATGAIALLGSLGAIVLFFFEWAPFWSNGRVPSAVPLGCVAGLGEGCIHYIWSFGPFASVEGVVACLAVLTAGLAFLRSAALTRTLLALTAASGIAAAIVIHAVPFRGSAQPPLEAPLFFSLVALAAMIGRPAGRRWLGLSLGGWALAWLVILELGWGRFGQDRVRPGSGAQGFFLDAADRDTVAECIATALLGAVILVAANRTTAALVVVASTVLWLPIWFHGVLVTNYRGFDVRWPELFALLGYLVVGALFVGRRSVRQPHSRHL